ncbi:MAG: tetratricopeptide repeat protein [Synergistaceae bacterium]|nr:tetratricopeptide repeat protein [Synergistaceae bacterium]
MNHDLMDWLRDSINNKDDSTGTGLLLAPISITDKDLTRENVNVHETQESQAINSEINNLRENISNPLEAHEKNINAQESHESQIIDSQNITGRHENFISTSESHESQAVNSEINNVQENTPDSESFMREQIINSQNISDSHEQSTQESHETQIFDSQHIIDPDALNREQIINSQKIPDVSSMDKAQQEAATGFQLSLDEPPPELWGEINFDDDEDSSILYEQYQQGINFQEYNNQTPHGTNFTQRLQRILQERRERAAAENEKNSEPIQISYIKRAAVYCTSLVITILIAWLVLIYLQKKTPDYLNNKALALYNAGNFQESANEYQRAYKLYPDVLTFLRGLALSSEKAGNLQTAKISWEQYINSLPANDSADIEFAKNELSRLNNNNEPAQTKPEPEKITPLPTQKTPPTFSELMREGTESLNLGIYDSAIINFSQAIELNPNEINAYIGLIASYRHKGLYFDAKRIYDDAIKKFGRNPTLLTELQFLKEAH